MAKRLEYPELQSIDGAARPALEISLDFLPKNFEGRWLDVVRGFTADWVARTSFKAKATIWMWGAMSVNLAHRHPSHPVPSWSEFLIAFGFPPAFFEALATLIEDRFEGQAGITQQIDFNEDAGWTAICHVECGRAWMPLDQYIFEPVRVPRGI